MKTRSLSLICSLLLFPAGAALADSFFNQFKDSDGWMDVSDFVLNNAVGFMPVPIIITEPAVGEGLGLAAAFFHPPKDYSQKDYETAGQKSEAGDKEFVLPDITAVAAAATNNGTWFVGGGHFAHWKDDSIRYEGILGYANVVMKFYGEEGGDQSSDEGFEFTGEAVFIQQPFDFRIKESNWFVGVEYDYSKIETVFDIGGDIPGFPPLVLDATLSGLGVAVKYENFDTPFTPSAGMQFEFEVLRNDEALGSDYDYTSMSTHIHYYKKLGEKWVLGLRGKAQSVSGDAPFYMLPFIDMRGIPALRYQGEAMGLVEAEARWAFHPRISLVGFLGAGKAAESFSDLSSATTRAVQGLGIRYFLARKLGMHAGIDVAKGPEDTYWYLTIGGAWR